MKRIRLIVLAIVFLTMLKFPTRAPKAAAQGSLEPDCLFFAETGGEEGGFFVCDDNYARFRTAFDEWGLQKIGYPISDRYRHDGFVTQAFQKAIMQWRPDGDYVALVNVFDDLHNAGFDDTLLSVRQTPHQLPAGWDGDIPFNEVIKKRQALLDVRPALRETYFASSDPFTFYGLPTSEVEDMGNHYAIRLQRAVLQEWKEEVAWAKEGEVTIANGGDIAKELAALPRHALIPRKVVDLPSSANTLFHHPIIADVAWANDHTLVVAAADGIWLYDTNALESSPHFLNGSVCLTNGLPCVRELTISHNGEWLATSLMRDPSMGEPNSLLLWSLTNLGDPKVLANSPIFLGDLAISSNGKNVAFIDPTPPPPLFPSGEEGPHDIYIWDVVLGSVKRLPNSSGPITALTFASDGAVVMAGIQKFAEDPQLLNEGIIRRWNVSNGEEMNALSVKLPIAFSPDGQTAATQDINGTNLAQLWDLSGEPVISGSVGAPLSPGSILFHFAFSQDSSKLAATIRSPEEVFNIDVWDLNRGSQLGSVPTGTLMAWSPGGRLAVFRDWSRTNNHYWLWDVTQNKQLLTLTEGRLDYISFSPNDHWLASGDFHLIQLSHIE